MLIEYKRIYDYDKNLDDGYVIYIDKMYPRGLNKSHVGLKHWIKNVAPSMNLIKTFHKHGLNGWIDFKKDYYKQLKQHYKDNIDGVRDTIDNLIKQVKKYKKILILYSSKDERYNNARVFAKFLRNIIIHY